MASDVQSDWEQEAQDIKLKAGNGVGGCEDGAKECIPSSERG